MRIETDRAYPLILATILIRTRIDADEGLTEHTGSKIRFLSKKSIEERDRYILSFDTSHYSVKDKK